MAAHLHYLHSKLVPLVTSPADGTAAPVTAASVFAVTGRVPRGLPHWACTVVMNWGHATDRPLPELILHGHQNLQCWKVQ